MSIQFIAYVVVGKLLIFLIGQFFEDTKLKMLTCDLCSGVWVYTIFAGLFKIRLLEDVYFYVPLVSELTTGCIVSYAVHLLTIGFRERHLPVIV